MKKFEFTIKGNKYHVTVKDSEESNIVHVEVNGTEFDVEIENAKQVIKTPKLVRKTVVNKPGEGAIKKEDSKTQKVKSPLPGTIVKVNVNVGDEIKKGDSLLVMEAMKMENNVLAEKDGVVSKVNVSAGQAVLQSEVLVEIE